MRFSYTDTVVTPESIKKEIKRLSSYRETLRDISAKDHEYSLSYVQKSDLRQTLSDVRKNFPK